MQLFILAGIHSAQGLRLPSSPVGCPGLSDLQRHLHSVSNSLHHLKLLWAFRLIAGTRLFCFWIFWYPLMEDKSPLGLSVSWREGFLVRLIQSPSMPRTCVQKPSCCSSEWLAEDEPSDDKTYKTWIQVEKGAWCFLLLPFSLKETAIHLLKRKPTEGLVNV